MDDLEFAFPGPDLREFPKDLDSMSLIPIRKKMKQFSMDFIIMLLLIKEYKLRCTKPFFFHMGMILLRKNFVRGIVYNYIGRPHDLHTVMAYDLKT